jgi:hypothetical protein
MNMKLYANPNSTYFIKRIERFNLVLNSWLIIERKSNREQKVKEKKKKKKNRKQTVLSKGQISKTCVN